jgi:hypothetical protein
MRLENSHPEAERQQIVTESQNISASGVYCQCSHYLAPASKVALTIVLPRLPGGRTAKKELIKCEGIVVRCEPARARGEGPWELACMFSDLDEKRRRVLEDFVTWRNLQSLRAAAGAVEAPRRAARLSRTPGRAARAASSRPGTRRRTVH